MASEVSPKQGDVVNNPGVVDYEGWLSTANFGSSLNGAATFGPSPSSVRDALLTFIGDLCRDNAVDVLGTAKVILRDYFEEEYNLRVKQVAFLKRNDSPMSHNLSKYLFVLDQGH